MRTSLRTTTAVLACLNLALPGQGYAQEAGGSSGDDSVCVTDPASEACHDLIADGPDGGDDQGMDEAEIGEVPDPGAGIETDADGEVEAAPDPTVSGDDSVEVEPGNAQDEAVPDAPAEVVPDEALTGEGDSDESVVTEQEADPGAPASEPAISPADPDAGQGDQASQDGSGSQETSPAPGGETQRSDQNGSDTSATGSAPGEGATGSQAEQAETAAPAAPEASPRDRSQSSEDQSQATPPAQSDTPADSGSSDPAPATQGQSAPAAPSDNAGSTMSNGPGQGMTASGQQNGSAGNTSAPQPRSAESDVPSGQGDGTLEALGAGQGGAEPEEVVTETVTEETARSSSEDFDTGIDQSPEASDDEGGLSDLERALLLGAGALAVGAIMRGGREVVASSDDRVVVSGSDGGYRLIKDDNALLRQPGSEVSTQTFDDGSTRTVVQREDGSQIVTIRDPELRVVRRVRVMPDGQEILLIDDTDDVAPVDTSALRASAETQTFSSSMNEDALRRALAVQQGFDRSYSLNQIRSMEQVRAQVPAVDLETLTFATGSAAISPEQADELTQLGRYVADRIEENPREIFLVEGHTDAVGDAAYNLALSDRRAESVALALTEYFGVPPENLVVQGYGEQFLKVQTEAAEQANRRATLRRITPLLQAAASTP